MIEFHPVVHQAEEYLLASVIINDDPCSFLGLEKKKAGTFFYKQIYNSFFKKIG